MGKPLGKVIQRFISLWPPATPPDSSAVKVKLASRRIGQGQSGPEQQRRVLKHKLSKRIFQAELSALRKRFYIMLVARNAEGDLLKIPVPIHYLYVFVAGGPLCMLALYRNLSSYRKRAT